MKTKNELETEINSDEKCTRLSGEYKITLSDVRNIMVGRNYIRAGVVIESGNKIVDGIDAKIIFEINEDPCGTTALFCVLKNVRNFKFINMKAELRYSGVSAKSKICCFINYSYGFAIQYSDLDFRAENQISYTALYNEGGVDTTLESQADNLWLCENKITAQCKSEKYNLDNTICGIENIFGNSACITNNQILVRNAGVGEWQKAYGIRNSGKYVRIENNNIKANGSHNTGNLMEAAHAFGMINEEQGEYLVFSGNNCVAEWGGMCVGILNRARYANILGNKLHATHTIKGRTAILYGSCSILTNNILTSTSRNPRMIELLANENLIGNNYIRGLSPAEKSQSGVGIWMVGLQGDKFRADNCNITGNIIAGIKDFGIVLNNSEGNRIAGNRFISFSEPEDYVPIFTCDKKTNVIENNQFPRVYSEGGKNLYRNSDEAIHSIID